MFIKGKDNPAKRLEVRKILSNQKVGNKNPNWKGGKYISSGGYIYIKIGESKFNRSEYIFEHRLVMEKKLGRKLRKNEIVHHINEIKTDNRIENLELTHPKEHNIKHHIGKKLDKDHKLKISKTMKIRSAQRKRNQNGKFI